MRAAWCALGVLILVGCEVDGTVGSTIALTAPDAVTSRDVSMEATPDVVDSVDASAVTDVRDASDVETCGGLDAAVEPRDVVRLPRDARSEPETVPCGAMNQCPLGRWCEMGTCRARWMSCEAAREVCNGLDDDCDGVVDNGIECGGGAACPDGLVRCPTGCLDLRSTAFHCGSCEGLCSSRSCENGVCS
ncbi:MAG: hypothetical protein Q8Q09_19000 [Deltaproteobacteria bacterium]|nr:hypothetical protein [Deltaproteobacteria bacterium]